MKNRTTYHRTSDRTTTAQVTQEFNDLLRVYTGAWTFQRDPRTGAWVAGPAPRPTRTFTNWHPQDPGPKDETPLTNEMNW